MIDVSILLPLAGCIHSGNVQCCNNTTVFIYRRYQLISQDFRSRKIIEANHQLDFILKMIAAMACGKSFKHKPFVCSFSALNRLVFHNILRIMLYIYIYISTRGQIICGVCVCCEVLLFSVEFLRRVTLHSCSYWRTWK